MDCAVKCVGSVWLNKDGAMAMALEAMELVQVRLFDH